MLSDIMIGQFFPGKSILHRLDAMAKILMLFALIISIFYVTVNMIIFCLLYLIL
ncbi:hypothetical protein [Pectinatus sottacetonis]|uniref:hypothetical protein n=1 Tax=Pectinatus sottacetonis TaxID=1002795 RepID=UPI0018C6D18C|nr:hypothetical protein [Pectinatus sottacetonis]